MFVTAVKDAIEDWRRTALDNELNNLPVHRLVDWNNVNSSDENISLWRRVKKATTRIIVSIYRLGKGTFAKKKDRGKTYAERALDETRASGDTRITRRSMMSSQTSFHSVDDIQMTPVPSPQPGQKPAGSADRPETAFSYDDERTVAEGNLTVPGAEPTIETSKFYGSLIDPLKQVSGKARFKKDYWKSVRVGDFVRIYNEDQIPADVVVLSTSDPDGACYVETKNLDGETSLKVRQALHSGRKIKHAKDCEQTSFVIESEPPHANLYAYSGVATCIGGIKGI